MPEINEQPPSLEELADMARESYGETPCGCHVEPDGICGHGRESWLRILGWI